MASFARTPIGMVLKRLKWLLTPPQLPQMGNGCIIHPMARFEGHMKNVRLGNNVIIDAYAIIHCHKDGKIEIGDGSYIGDGSIIHTGKREGRVIIGRDCTVQAYSVIYGNGGCEIGDFVRIATHTVMVSSNKRYADPDTPIYKQGSDKRGIKIGEDVWFGAGGVVLDNVVIGRGTVVAAGAVVNQTISDMTVVGGVPAREIGRRGNQPNDGKTTSDAKATSHD